MNSMIGGIALLTYAAATGRHRILHLLAQHPSIQLNAFRVMTFALVYVCSARTV